MSRRVSRADVRRQLTEKADVAATMIRKHSATGQAPDRKQYDRAAGMLIGLAIAITVLDGGTDLWPHFDAAIDRTASR